LLSYGSFTIVDINMLQPETTDIQLEGRLPLSLVEALKANGVDPHGTSVASAEAWSPQSRADLGSVEEDRETRALVASTLRRISASVTAGLGEEARAELVSAADAIEEEPSLADEPTGFTLTR
jgi:hypothetical protein